MSEPSEPKPSRRFRLLGRRDPEQLVEPTVAQPLGYEAESQWLTEQYRSGRIDRPSYESTRRRLQLAYGVGILPDARGREA